MSVVNKNRGAWTLDSINIIIITITSDLIPISRRWTWSARFGDHNPVILGRFTFSHLWTSVSTSSSPIRCTITGGYTPSSKGQTHRNRRSHRNHLRGKSDNSPLNIRSWYTQPNIPSPAFSRDGICQARYHARGYSDTYTPLWNNRRLRDKKLWIHRVIPLGDITYKSGSKEIFPINSLSLVHFIYRHML